MSSDAMCQRMSGRKMISIPKLHFKMKDGDIEGDWVTIGVIVDKLPPRQVATHTHIKVTSSYCITGKLATKLKSVKISMACICM